RSECRVLGLPMRAQRRRARACASPATAGTARTIHSLRPKHSWRRIGEGRASACHWWGVDDSVCPTEGHVGLTCALELLQDLRGHFEVSSLETFRELIVNRREQALRVLRVAMLGSDAHQ